MVQALCYLHTDLSIHMPLQQISPKLLTSELRIWPLSFSWIYAGFAIPFAIETNWITLVAWIRQLCSSSISEQGGTDTLLFFWPNVRRQQPNRKWNCYLPVALFTCPAGWRGFWFRRLTRAARLGVHSLWLISEDILIGKGKKQFG